MMSKKEMDKNMADPKVKAKAKEKAKAKKK